AGSFRPLGATLVPTGDDRGRLVVHWGPHEWAADFTVVREPSDAAAVLLQPGASFRDCLSCPELVVQPEGRLALGRYEVTREEYAAFARATGYDADAGCYVLQVAPNDRGEPSASILREDASASWRYPGFWQAGRHPVACVGLDDAQAYVAWLTRTTGATYRLPTDTEWKQAAQGTRGECAANGADVSLKQYLDLRFHVTFDSLLACEQSDGAATTSEVGSYPPNEAGLFDMVGNVWEWTGDCWKDDCGLRVVRGGSWFYGPKDLHIDAGRFGSVGARYSNGGFRVARTLD
ncbi:MAG: SUMF1/EgtB/PvdO family nonheme iron enzyme, partial [Acidobacteriota bacterium]|nr:SUMF1/EgtB/PvdO family nonheme iron enzyme [Acidobacteriota bacterium]